MNNKIQSMTFYSIIRDNMKIAQLVEHIYSHQTVIIISCFDSLLAKHSQIVP